MPLTDLEKAGIRRGVCKGLNPSFDKIQINTAIQAGKDWLTSNKASAASAIETAVPGVFSVAEKKKIFAYILENQFQEDK